MNLTAENSIGVQRNKDWSFEEQYLALRRQEQRLYSDEQVLQLPEISRSHPHYHEWKVRKRSAEKLIAYLLRLKKPLRILEVGCGNGWLSNQLARIPHAQVTGFDINQTELQQAGRVFHHQSNLQFITDDPFLLTHTQKSYDVMVFAAAIQYFASLQAVLSNARRCLTEQGEIHIIDSHFYRDDEIPAARQRSAHHYASLGFPFLSEHYFHHAMHALKPFHARLLYNPASPWNWWQRKSAPFPWICIEKK